MTSEDRSLDGAQQAVVEHKSGPLCVIGAPGTGKTTVLLEAALARLHNAANPHSVLSLTFGRQAALDLRYRLVLRLNRTTTEPLARTFHSYAYAILRRAASANGNAPPRLLSGPEQDVIIRELLAGDAAGVGIQWPEELRSVIGTRAFAGQLRDLLLRSYERGIDAVTLDRWAQQQSRDDWRAAARFLQQYADVTELADAGHSENLSGGTAYDPAELIRAACACLRGDQDLLAFERRQRPHIFVDEYHDVDPAQEEFLQLLAGDGQFLVVFGDPASSIYGFRGTEPDILRRFDDRFRHVNGAPASTITLATSYRAKPELSEATARVAARLRGTSAPSPAHFSASLAVCRADEDDGRTSAPLSSKAPDASKPRELTKNGEAVVEASEGPPGRYAVRTMVSASQEAAYIAGYVRRAHLLRGIPYGSIAVIVRSGVAVEPLRRVLVANGVPAKVEAAELPLAQQPAVRPLLALLRSIVDPESLDEETAIMLLSSSFGEADALTLRRLAAAIAPSTLTQVLLDPVELVAVEERWASSAAAIARFVEIGRGEAAKPGVSVEQVLWSLWNASALADRWTKASAAGGSVGAAADRDLDAVIALFDAARRFTERLPAAGIALFLDHVQGQQIPGDARSDHHSHQTVEILTAHGAKGREWDCVVIAGVQEGVWPDLRLRGTLLGIEDLVDLAADRPLEDAGRLTKLLDEERRLFYVAVTRAASELLVTAVNDEDQRPSRFLDELDPLPPETVRSLARVSRPATLSALVAELRSVVEDQNHPDRAAAARQLVTLAAAGVPGASVNDWLGLADVPDPCAAGTPAHPSECPIPIPHNTSVPSRHFPRNRGHSDADEAVFPENEANTPGAPSAPTLAISPSSVESVTRCGLRWFLERHGGAGEASPSQEVGLAVHEVAAALPEPADAVNREALTQALETGLEQRDLGTGWVGRRRRSQAQRMVNKLADWLTAREHTFVGAEKDFSVDIADGIVLRGRVDRLEQDEQKRAVVIDFKTGTSAPTRAELPEHVQLGMYQLAVQAGGFENLAGCESGGAALVQLGTSTKSAGEQLQPPLSETRDPDWALQIAKEAIEAMTDDEFRAQNNPLCRACPVQTSCPLHTEQLGK